MLPDYLAPKPGILGGIDEAVTRAKQLIDYGARLDPDDLRVLELDHAVVDELQRIEELDEETGRYSFWEGYDYAHVLNYAKQNLGEQRVSYIEYQSGRLQGEEARQSERDLHLTMFLYGLVHGFK